MQKTIAIAVTLTLLSLAPAARVLDDWPQFRGPGARGIADGPAPTTWDVPGGKGVKWKTAIPGLGHSSPVLSGDLVCVTTATSAGGNEDLKVGLYGDIKPVEDDTEHQWQVYCLNRTDGEVRWKATAATGVPEIQRHTKSTHANSTLATDGDTLVAMFGSEGLYAFALADGALRWKKDLGTLDSGFFRVPEAQWGFASSPVIHDGRVIIQADVQEGSFVAALSLKDGSELWRTARDDVPGWSTPAVHVGDDRAQVIVNGWKHIGGYDLATGEEVWRLEGGGDIPVPTPVVVDDLVYITNAHGPAAPIYAIRTSAAGDITPSADSRSEYVVWHQNREGAYMQTPLIMDGLLYNCRDNGVLSVYDARTGERVYQQRLADGRTGFTASPVAAGDKVYFTSEDGDIYVIKAGRTFEQLARNPMGEVCMATPAIAGGVMYFRTRGHLVAIE